MSSRFESCETPVNPRSTRAKLASFSIFLGTTIVAIVAVPSAAFAADFSSYMDTSDLQALTNGLAWYALLTAAVGMLISAMLWWSGSQSQNMSYQLVGKNGFVVSLTAAFLVGATPTLVNWLQDVSATSDVDKAGVTSATPFSGGQLANCGPGGVSASCSPSGNLNPNVATGGTPPSLGRNEDCLTPSGRVVAC